MIYIFISFIIFISTVINHVIFYRLDKKIKNVKELNMLVFPLWLLIQILVQNLIKSSVIINSTIFYICLILIYLIYFFSFKSGEKSPSAKLFLALNTAQKQKLAKKEIIALYSDSEITDRLDMLVDVGVITKEKDKYKILPKGHTIAKLVQIYRKILGWEVGG